MPEGAVFCSCPGETRKVRHQVTLHGAYFLNLVSVDEFNKLTLQINKSKSKFYSYCTRKSQMKILESAIKIQNTAQLSCKLTTMILIAANEAIVKENHRITVNEIATHLDMSHGSAHHIVCDVLQFYKYLIFNKLINI
jgi:hypothetical protein